jgi:hypothetical protein
MARTLLTFSFLALMGPVACGQTGDLGAQIAAKDAQLGSQPGAILVTTSGTVSEGKVSLSAGHNLICSPGVTISLTAGSYLYQNSSTSIENCVIAATSTPIAGEVQSVDTEQVALTKVTFVGGGNLVYWSGVTGFSITDNNVVSITAVDLAAEAPENGFYLWKCSQGVVDNLKSDGFVFPAAVFPIPSVLELNLSNNITINNPTVHNVDASYILSGGAVIEINGSTNITINGGNITHNANMDGVLSQSHQVADSPAGTPSSQITIDGLNSSYNGAVGLKPDVPLALGDGLDIINTSHVWVSHATLNGNGNGVHDLQPGIWFFLDDDVTVSDSDISQNSAAGISSAGTPNILLVRDTINQNQSSGVFTEWQACTATNVGPVVSFVSGPSGGFGLDWLPGTTVVFDGVTYQLAQVIDSGHLKLATSPPDHSSPVGLGINTTQNIIDSVIDDNGVGQWSSRLDDQYQVGILWADGTSGTISGVTSTNTGIGAQLYGLMLDNSPSVTLYNDDFSGNLLGGDGIYFSGQGTSPTSLVFTPQQVGTTSAAQTISFFVGMINTPDLRIQTSGNFSQTNNCNTFLAAYSTCQIQVTFTPTIAGPQNGTLIIADGAPNSPQTISLTGTGVAENQGTSSTTVSFSTQAVATTSSAQTITLWAGPIGLSNLVIQTSGNFSQTNNCGQALAAFGTCQIQITFTPTVPGTQTGTLSIMDNAPNSPQTISLTGIGVNNIQGASSSSVSFPGQQLSTTSAPQTITLWAGAVALRNLLVRINGSFSQTNNCGSSLAAFATCQIQITFAPTALGTLQGTLTITDSAAHNPPAISLTGTGIPAGLGLGIAAGSSNAATVTAGTPAKYLLSIGGAGISGMASLSCLGVPAGESCSLPATESVSASQATIFAVNVTAATQTMGALHPPDLRRLSGLWGLAILGIVLGPVRRARTGHRRYPVSLLLLLLVFFGCAGVSSNPGGALPGTYYLTVTAKIGTTSQQIPLVLTLQ